MKRLQEVVIAQFDTKLAASIVFAPKKHSSLRFCVDCRERIAVIKQDVYPIAGMDKSFDSLGESAVFSTLDGKSNYWQIEMKNED